MSQLTSTTTDKRRLIPASEICLGSMKKGILDVRYMQLTKMSTSRISWNGPPLAVSSKSHLRISSLPCDQNKPTQGQKTTDSSSPIFLNRSTAPRPQRPSAPMTSALTPFPLPPNNSLTFLTIAVSFSKGDNRPRS